MRRNTDPGDPRIVVLAIGCAVFMTLAWLVVAVFSAR